MLHLPVKQIRRIGAISIRSIFHKMILPGHLTAVVWLASTYLSLCEGSPTQNLHQFRHNEGDDKFPLMGTEGRYSTSSPYHQTLHHRSRPHKNHRQPNATHSHSFKLYSTKRHDLNDIDSDESYINFIGHISNKKLPEERTERHTKRKRGDGRKRKKKDDMEEHRQFQGNSGWGSDVDDVLASLVGYSKDPSLWRFVHSVVAELDYSKQASNNGPRNQRGHYTLHHLSSKKAKDIDNSDKKGSHGKKNDSQSQLISLDDNGADYRRVDGVNRNDEDGGKEREDIVKTEKNHYAGNDRNFNENPIPASTENAAAVSNFEEQNSQEQFHAAYAALEQPRESPAITSSVKINKSGITPTHTPHFIFHKVYIDTNYDPHTRQPYHRPVLAVKAVAGEKPKASVINKDNEDGFPDAMETYAYHLPDVTSRELPDKLEDILVHQNREVQTINKELSNSRDILTETNEHREELGEEEDVNDEDNDNEKGIYTQYYRRNLFGTGKEKEFLRRDLQKDWSEDDDKALEILDADGWQDVSTRHHHKRHFLHRLRQLQSFESQLKFLRRWQERLLRKRNQWSPYYQMSMT